MAFAPSTPSVVTVQQQQQSSSFALSMSDEVGDMDPLETVPLALKMVGVLSVKTLKDVVNYPPMLLDETLRHFQQDDAGLPRTSALVMVIKLVGVLLFKSLHDAVYYPTLWTQRMVECQSLDECELQ